VTDEPASLVAPWIAKHGVTHPVVILPDGALEAVIGVTGFPTSAVFLGMEMQWKGHPSGSGSALSSAQKDGKKGSLYPKKLSKIIKAMNEGDSAKALGMLRAGMAKFKDRDADWAKRLDAFLIETSEKDFLAANKAIELGYWHEGVELASKYLGKDSLFPGAVEAQAILDKLEDEKLYKKEIAGGKLYLEAKALADDGEYLEAVKGYKAILKKCGDTNIANHARAAAQGLIDGRKPGYKAQCPKCRANKGAACEKHLEKVKL
jgi:hypothetical protein